MRQPRLILRYGPVVLFLLVCHVRPSAAGGDATAAADSLPLPTFDQSLVLSHEKLKPGARIKVWPAAGSLTGLEKHEQLQGYLHSCKDGILTMAVGSREGQQVSLPLAEVTAVQVRTGGTGAALGGALVGALVGGIAAAATQPDRSNEPGFIGFSHLEEDMQRGLALVLGGIAVGAGLAGARDHGKWENVSVRYEAAGGSGHSGQPGEPGSSLKLAYGLRF